MGTDNKEVLHITPDDLKLLIDIEVLKTRMDSHDKAFSVRQLKEEEIWKEVFTELKLIRELQNGIPLQIEKMKQQIEEDMKDEYITAKELKAILRTAIIIGGIAISTINGIFAYFVMHNTGSTAEEINRQLNPPSGYYQGRDYEKK